MFMKGMIRPREKAGSIWLAWEDLYCLGIQELGVTCFGQSGVQYSPSSPNCHLS